MIDAIPLLLAPEGYQISRSVRLRSSASAYFNRTPGSASNRKTWTWSGWVKRGSLASAQVLFAGVSAGSNATILRFSDSTINFYNYASTAYNGELQTTAVYRDASAWYHIVAVWDTPNATAGNRMRLYVNGSEVTAFTIDTAPTQNSDGFVNNTSANYLGVDIGFNSQYFDGYLTEVNFIDGQALTPSSFGETNQFTGVWQPKKYAGTYGTNGFYLNFSDNSNNTAATIGKDYSGNGNNWTPNNISVTAGVTYDSMLDVPTQWADGGNGRGNYCTLNPLDKNAGTTPSNANLTWTASTPWRSARATFGRTTGKWYWEVTASGANNMHGIGTATAAVSDNNYPGKDANGWGYFDSNGNKFTNGSGSSYGASYTTNDMIGVAFDADNGTLTFYKNGTSQGTAFTGLTSGPYFPMVGNEGSTSHSNFGQRPFAYTPPTGFRALNTLNLPTPTILKGNQFFDAKLFTSNDSVNVISGLAFAPDFVWTKRRDQAYNHDLYDSVRGIEKRLQSNNTNAENTDPNTLTAFNSDGFTLGTNDNANNSPSGGSAVAWTWKEGPTQGFDIVTFTGTGAAQNISHSLGVAPRMIIYQARTGAGQNWSVGHASVNGGVTPFNFNLKLNLTDAATTSASVFNNTAPTSSVFTVGNNTVNGINYVAYLFSEVAGFSRFGSYTGNGSADGPFCFTGFLPRWIMIKRTDTTANWRILDTARDTFNVEQYELYPNLSNAEGTFASLDGLSNGFKIRNTDTAYNASGGTYIFAAFSETSFKYALGR
jgi:hypothetical protein